MMHSLRVFLLYALFLLTFVSPSFAQSSITAISTATAGPLSSQPTAAPACAKSCVGTATNTQSCAPGNQTCLCSYSTQIQESIYNCLVTTSACDDSERTAAFEYYPVFCKSLNLAVETTVPTMLMTAGGSAPTAATDSNLSGQTTTTTPDSSDSGHGGLQLPAILGIVLVVVVMIVGVAAMMVWSCVRRRQALKAPRMDLGGEFVEPKSRPPRSKSVNSEFMVQPSPVEKDLFGEGLSRSSTLVPPPPVAKDERRSSEQQRYSARNHTLKALLGSEKTQPLSSIAVSDLKQTSPSVPPFDVKEDDDQQARMSKF